MEREITLPDPKGRLLLKDIEEIIELDHETFLPTNEMTIFVDDLDLPKIQAILDKHGVAVDPVETPESVTDERSSVEDPERWDGQS